MAGAAQGGRAVAFLVNPVTAPNFGYYLNPIKAAAASVALAAVATPVHDLPELESAIAAQARGPDGGLVVMPEPFLNHHRAEVISLAARYRLPAIYPYCVYTELEGLMSYGIYPAVERLDPGLSFPVVLGIRHQHADPPHPVGLPRARATAKKPPLRR